ncbi:hypothetical protein C8D89_103186 [Actinomycetospora cinnamomea]|uniref:Uncharacterized protein n=1 Tax=Actinomycetospora cinnamomea TaxID=663609 RepID=A0A2U1FI47_9PSEU|nr:hypothetical protein C8D89_103186 [Actinomycetospora cinnamomea]
MRSWSEASNICLRRGTGSPGRLDRRPGVRLLFRHRRPAPAGEASYRRLDSCADSPVPELPSASGLLPRAVQVQPGERVASALTM